jgi:Flp pilus assembly pilin Flp
MAHALRIAKTDWACPAGMNKPASGIRTAFSHSGVRLCTSIIWPLAKRRQDRTSQRSAFARQRKAHRIRRADIFSRQVPGSITFRRGRRMRSGFRTPIGKLQLLLRREDGQDMVEYALLITLMAAGITATTQRLAVLISSIFSNITTVITTNIT